jgi:hypothetical protein
MVAQILGACLDLMVSARLLQLSLLYISHGPSRKCQTTVHTAAPNSAPSVRSLFHTTLLAPAQFKVTAGFLENLRAPANTTPTLRWHCIANCSTLFQLKAALRVPNTPRSRRETVEENLHVSQTQRWSASRLDHLYLSVPVTGIVILVKGRMLHSREPNPGHVLKWRTAQGVIKSVNQCNSSALMECDIVQPLR